MIIKIVPSDGLVSVDGARRIVDLTDIDVTLHALQFDTVLNKGRAWHKDEVGDTWQADVEDFAPFQVYLDRWTAAAPPPPPPPEPPIDLSDMNNLEKSLKTLALCIAQVGGLTVPQIKALFKQKWDSLP